ncbi:MAG: hypothetical protein WKF37_17915 [Bryobacteraceae bacterium]
MHQVIEFAGLRTIRLDASDMGFIFTNLLGFVARSARLSAGSAAMVRALESEVDGWFDVSLDRAVIWCGSFATPERLSDAGWRWKDKPTPLPVAGTAPITSAPASAGRPKHSSACCSGF